MMKMLLICFFFTFNLMAAEWSERIISGARCGDGKPYSIFIQKRNPNKLLIEFMGGGVCWDHRSCFERISLFPWMHRYPLINSYSVLTANHSKINPFKDHTKIYFPYCTADVHAGSHISHYNKRVVYHYGRRNIELALESLKKEETSFATVNDLVVYGASAGGIASLLYGKDIESLVDPLAKKTMIVDSPGLHFGKTFWNKFDSEMKIDFKEAFHRVDLDVDFNDGAVSKKMKPVLLNYENWELGFIYGLQDNVMSSIFGDISPAMHKKLILSEDGLPFIARDFKNVKFWLKDTRMHTFLLSKYSANLKGSNNEGTVSNFVREIYFKLPH